MRIKYLSILIQKIQKVDLIWGLRHAFKYLAIKLSYMRNRAFCGPIVGMLFVTFRCNFKCIMCSCPEFYRGKNQELSTDEMLKVIDGFAKIGASALTFTGGEPTLREDIEILIRHAKRRRLITNLFTNGFLLDDSKIERLLDTGLDLINIPLDGINAETHDGIRNIKGAHEKAIYNIKRIITLRNHIKNKLSLSLTCVICKNNIDEILDLVPFVSGLGVDHISFIPLQTQNNSYKESLRPDPDKAKRVISQLAELRKHSKIIDCSSAYLKFLGLYYANKECFVKCYAGYVSCAVDSYGNIHPCTLKSPMVANVRDIALEKCWYSEKFNQARRAIKNCQYCSWNDWVELSLLFN